MTLPVPDALALSVACAHEGRLLISLRYFYEGRLPARGKRIEMAKAMLREALDRLEGGEVTELGFSENAQRRVRTDRMEA